MILIGPKEQDICTCDEGGQHHRLLSARGWEKLADLDPRQIRALAPVGMKLAPNAKPATLADAVTAAVLAGMSLSSKGWVSHGTGQTEAPPEPELGAAPEPEEPAKVEPEEASEDPQTPAPKRFDRHLEFSEGAAGDKFPCVHPGCGKVYKSKSWLTRHEGETGHG